MANLARLKLDEEEARRLANDMNDILGYMDKLNEVDTTGVEPLEHVTDLVIDYRKDTPHQPISHDEALRNAPDADSDYFRVPRVIE